MLPGDHVSKCSECLEEEGDKHTPEYLRAPIRYYETLDAEVCDLCAEEKGLLETCKWCKQVFKKEDEALSDRRLCRPCEEIVEEKFREMRSEMSGEIEYD